jgi:hypothetical protein
MLINPEAVEKLRDVTTMRGYPGTTHRQRNEAIRSFLAEAGHLLDRQAESTVKHAVERYGAGELSYEDYQALIEQVGREEAKRGAALAETFARNRVFELAQRFLDQAQEHARQLQLLEARKQLEQEQQKTERLLRDLMQQHTDELQRFAQQIKEDLTSTHEAARNDVLSTHQTLLEQTRQQVDRIILQYLQEERERQQREIREQEEQRPAREAVRTAIERVRLLEQRYSRHQWRLRGMVGLGLGIFLVFLVWLFFAPPLWIEISTSLIAVALLVSAALWKNPVPEERLAAARREIALYQARSGEYAPLSEEERRALLLQRIA